MEVNAAERTRWNDPGWVRAWRKREAITATVTPVLMHALRLRVGERVLDIGCGGGRTTIEASRAVGPTGRAVGADISVPLLGVARERAGDLAGVDFQPADLQVDRVDGAPFDVGMSQFGVMFFADPAAAFANIGRHLRSGGRLGFACWQAAEKNPWFVGPVLAPFVSAPQPGPPGGYVPGPFALGDPDRVRRLLGAAGFGDVVIQPVEHAVDVPVDTVGDDAQLTFMGVPPEALDEARVAVGAYMRRFAAGNGLRLPLAYQVVTATYRV